MRDDFRPSRRTVLGGLAGASLSTAIGASDGRAANQANGEAMAIRRARLRELGITIGELRTGTENAITDVPGVLVGHATLQRPGVRTGVTAIVPPTEQLDGERIAAGFFSGNGYGKFVGTTQLEERGELETPVLLTGTLSTFRAADALVEWILEQPGHEELHSVNPVVGETNDCRWKRRHHRAEVGAEQVRAALHDARSGPVAEGCVGAGTGTAAFGYKAGIGTASRLVELDGTEHTVGVLVQSNFGGHLRIAGLPVGKELQAPEPRNQGSIVVVAATDAPLDARQLTRIARRCVFGLGATGSGYQEGSGDYGLAFSTSYRREGSTAPESVITGLSAGVLECVEEAVLNSLTTAEPTHGEDGIFFEALPLDRVVEFCGRHGIPAHLPS